MITITAFVTAYQTSKGVFWSREEAEQKQNRNRVFDKRTMKEVLESVTPVSIAIGPSKQKFILQPIDYIK
jgi:glycerol-3-phosphate cytidylyltransferase-like family protein